MTDHAYSHFPLFHYYDFDPSRFFFSLLISLIFFFPLETFVLNREEQKQGFSFFEVCAAPQGRGSHADRMGFRAEVTLNQSRNHSSRARQGNFTIKEFLLDELKACRVSQNYLAF